ncbi:MAG: hypothetical protein QXG00_07865 [Candidatus Woesearchaeota archaeon]
MEKHKPFATFDLNEIKNKEIKESAREKTKNENTISKEPKDARPLFSAVTIDHIKKTNQVALMPLLTGVLGCVVTWVAPPLLAILFNFIAVYISFQKKRKEHKYIEIAKVISILGVTISIVLLIIFLMMYWGFAYRQATVM